MLKCPKLKTLHIISEVNYIMIETKENNMGLTVIELKYFDLKEELIRNSSDIIWYVNNFIENLMIDIEQKIQSASNL